jgi:hypothetical protein
MKNEEFIKEILVKEVITLEEGCELINQYIFDKKGVYLNNIIPPNQHEIILHIKLGIINNFALYNKMFFISEAFFKEKYKE